MDRVRDLLDALTLDEKASLTAGADLWTTAAVERVGIPGWRLTDGPNGARGGSLTDMSPSVCVPCGTGLGATWNPELLEAVGAVLGAQARTKDARVLLAPTVNLHRSPLGGRTFESYSEDPLLAGRLAAAFVQGVQANGVATTVKHFAANEAEYERNTIDSVVDERTLRELYLVPFELAVRDGGALGIMTAYNRLNGTWCSEHAPLMAIARDEWGFDGLFVTDWYAMDSTVGSAGAGLDLEMPGPGRQYGAALADAVRQGELAESVVDDIVRRILGVFARLEALDDPPPGAEQVVDRPEDRAVARRAATEATVLLKNDGVLPFAVEDVRTLAVIGPNAARAQIIGGGSATLEPHHRTSPLDALRARLGSEIAITHEPGCDIDRTVPPLALELEEVVVREDGTEALRRTATSARLMYFGPPAPDLGRRWSVRVRGTVVPEVDGPHEVTLVQAGRARVSLGGRVVVDGVASPPPPGTALFGMGSEQVAGVVDLVAGAPVELTIDLSNDEAPLLVGVVVGLRPLPPSDLVDRAVAAAAAADAVVVVVGTNDDWESEGHDRTTLALPGDQDELVRRVCAVNRNTAVVLNAGAPVAVPWADDVPALLDVWFGGQEMADALVDVLVGDTDPSGRLPLTFPRSVEDTPAFGNFPGEYGEVRYGEGLLMGYRWYDTRRIPVAFPFGHGLSYATIDIGAPTVEVVDAEGGVTLTVPVHNRGDRAGAEVVQCYVEPVTPPVFRPRRELKGFAKVWLQPDERSDVVLVLDARAFAHWVPDPTGYDAVRERQEASTVSFLRRPATPFSGPGWHVAPGEYRIHVGRSIADLPHTLTITL
jgi:beta-glucosidase